MLLAGGLLLLAAVVLVPLFRTFSPEAKVATAAAAVYPLMTVLSLFFDDDVRRSADGSTRALWSPAYLPTGQTVFTVVSVALVAGLVVGTVLGSRRDAVDELEPRVQSAPTVLPVSALTGLLVAGAVVLVAQVLSRPIGDFVVRDAYIPDDVGILNAIVGQLAPLGAAAAAVAATAGRGPRRLAGLVFTGYIVIAYASATRVLGLLALLYLGAMFINGRRIPPLVLVRQVVLTALGTAIALSSRGQTSHGLLPYTQALVADPLGSLGDGLGLFVGAALLGPALAGTVVGVGTVTTADLATSLNPLPSTLTDWADIAPGLRVFSFVPYNGIGELWVVSPAAAVAFFFVVGVLTAVSLRVLWPATGRAGPLLKCLALILAFYPLILLSQYNLRSAARFLWLELGIVTVVVVMRIARPRWLPERSAEGAVSP